jgi:hypothetical protein
MEVDGQCHAWLLNLQERDLLPIVHKAGWAPGSVWAGAEKSYPHQDLNPSPCRLWQVTLLPTLSQPKS